MELYLVRHAAAEPAGPDMSDFDRPLSSVGRKRFEACVRGLSSLGVGFERVFHSPLLRATQTGELLVPLLDGESEVTPLLAAAPTDGLLALVRDCGAERVALVGHEPAMGDLCARLIVGSDKGQSFPFKKGGVAWLRGEPDWGGMELRAFLPPGVLRDLA